MWIRRNWGLVLLTGISLLAYSGMVRMQYLYGTLRDGRTSELIAWYLLAFVSYLGALVWAERKGISLRWLWPTAVLFRLLLLFTTPTLSDDVYRYLWDGYVANQGVSPYAYAIDAPELDYLQAPIRDQANNAWMASPYLPAAQLVFFGQARMFPLQPIFLQVIMIIFDLLSAWILARLLALALLPPWRLLLYLWNPLVIVEVAHGAHLDAWMLLLALLAVYLTLSDTRLRKLSGRWLAPIFLALATLTKPLPALLFPILFWYWNWRQRLLYPLLTFALLLPFGLSAGWGLSGELDGHGLFGAIRIYGEQWKFNSGIFHWLTAELSRRGVAGAADIGKQAIFFLLLILLVVVWLQARKRAATLPSLRLMSVPFMGYVLLTPTLHPWYILILIAFLPFLTPRPDEGRWRWLHVAPWIYLSGALVFSYLTYLDPLDYGELEWVRRLEWLPTLGLLLTAVVVTMRHHQEVVGPEG